MTPAGTSSDFIILYGFILSIFDMKANMVVVRLAHKIHHLMRFLINIHE